MQEFEYIKNEDGSFARKLNRGYGMSINDGRGHRKKQGLLFLKDWLLRKRGFDLETDRHVLNLHTIYEIELLQELLKYVNDKKKNFDRVSAMIVGMYALEELDFKNKAPQEEKTVDEESFFNRELFV